MAEPAGMVLCHVCRIPVPFAQFSAHMKKCQRRAGSVDVTAIVAILGVVAALAIWAWFIVLLTRNL